MKYLFIILALSFSSVYAEETKPGKTENRNNIQNVLKETKKDRKKKVEMCHECGKPEAQCDCEGEEHRKDH